MKREILKYGITGLLSYLFLYAAISKYADFKEFEISMHKQPLPYWFVDILIWTVPELEIAVVILLFIGFFTERIRILGLYGFTLLMAVFTAYILAILFHYFPRIPCSCGELIESLSWGQHLAFNLCFIALAIIAMRIKTQRLSNSIIHNS